MNSIVRLLRTGIMTVAWMMVLPSIAVLLAAIFPVIPWFRIYALGVVPNHTSWLFVWSISGLLIGLLANSLRRSSVALGLVAAASFSVLTTATVMLHLLYVAESNGARINVVRALALREFSDGARPDESHVYSRPLGEDLWLDIYHPQNQRLGALSPVMIAVHGGGFIEGSRTLGAANLRWYADHGWTVISIDYRLARAGRPTWDLAKRDVECAMAWTAANAGALRIDLNRLTLTGGSAGGSLAMAAAYSTNAGRAEPECGSNVPRVAAVIVKNPMIDVFASWYYVGELREQQRSYLTNYIGGSPEQFPDRYAAVDLRRFQLPSNPPTLILGGASDPLLPPESAIEFTRKATARGLEVRHILFPYSGHDFNTTYDSITNQALMQIIAQFVIDHGAGPEGAQLALAD